MTILFLFGKKKKNDEFLCICVSYSVQLSCCIGEDDDVAGDASPFPTPTSDVISKSGLQFAVYPNTPLYCSVYVLSSSLKLRTVRMGSGLVPKESGLGIGP